MLGNVLLFCCLVFFIFGIAGVQLLAGVLRNRCFFSQDLITAMNLTDSSSNQRPPFSMPPYYRPPDGDYICSSGYGILPCSDIHLYEQESSMCVELFGEGTAETVECIQWVGNYTDCRPDGPNPAKGSLSFDNIGSAWLAIFQVISLEGWTQVMYYVQDAYSFWVWIYFVVLVIVSSSYPMEFLKVKKK